MTLTAGQREQMLSTWTGTIRDAAGTYGPNGFVNYDPTLVADTGSNRASGVVAKDARRRACSPTTPTGTATRSGSPPSAARTAKVGQAVAGSFGTLTLAADGSYRYAATAPVASTGHDRFTYTVARRPRRHRRGGPRHHGRSLRAHRRRLPRHRSRRRRDRTARRRQRHRADLADPLQTSTPTSRPLAYIGRPTFHGIGNDLDNLILGGRNSDRLEGAGGSDTLVGGTGNDTYTVDDAPRRRRRAGREGTDRVLSQARPLHLSDNVEILALTTSASLNGTGNALDNTIRGNRGRNVLDGRGGADTPSSAARARTCSCCGPARATAT